tara:strand:- start:311 stop:799 length:489 start_codon:yes stop_codon:yes gene_type:complete
MKDLELNVYGFVISSSQDDGDITIKSDLNTSDNTGSAYSGAVGALETMICASFKAGIDVCAPSFLEAIEVTVGAIFEEYNKRSETSDLIEIHKYTRTNAIIERDIVINVPESAWLKVMKEVDSEQDALDVLSQQNHCHIASDTVNVVDTNAIFESSIDVIYK